MKSMNVKRIAAIASGAALMGAAFVGAAVQVDTTGVSSFPFFAAGEPNVKVVIGAKAMPEDVVVGGNIAAVLGNLAYKDQDVSVLNTDKLGTSGEAGDLTDKQASLTITTPGFNPANVYEMKAYVHDDLDNATETTRYTTESSRFQGQNTSFISLGVNAGPKVISKDTTSVISPASGLSADGKITYPKGSTSTKEEEKVYAFAYVRYSDQTAIKDVVAENVKTGYEVTFTDPIPLCLDTSKNVTGATCTSDNDKLSKGNVEITFLGDKWTIFDYAVSNYAITSVTLGKQIAKKESFNIDDSVSTPDGYTIALKDISAFSPQQAQFDVIDKDGKTVLKKLYLEAGGSATVAEANNLVVKVNKVFPGAFAKQGLADVSMFSSQLVITNGAEITGGDSHQYWKGMIVSSIVGSTEAISKIQLYNDNNQLYKTTTTMLSGEKIDIIKGMPGYKFNFLGLEQGDVDNLQFIIDKGVSFTNSSGGTVTGTFLHITSTIGSAFKYAKSTGEAWIKLEDAATAQPWIANGTVFYQDASYNFVSTGTTQFQVPYSYGNDETATIVATHNATLERWLIAIPELTEDNAGSGAVVATNQQILLQYDVVQDQFADTLGTTTASKIAYVAGGTSLTNYIGGMGLDKGYISYRGTKFVDLTSSSAVFEYPKKVRKARFTLQKGADLTTTSTGGMESKANLKEGDTQDIGAGYKVRVDTITAKVSGGTAGDVTGKELLEPSVKKAAVVTALDTASNPLVVLDTDSEASSTSNLVVIGGQIVNTVAAGAGVALKSGDEPIVKVFGTTKLVVAGYSAADTKAAGNALISWLNDNRMSIRG